MQHSRGKCQPLDQWKETRSQTAPKSMAQDGGTGTVGRGEGGQVLPPMCPPPSPLFRGWDVAQSHAGREPGFKGTWQRVTGARHRVEGGHAWTFRRVVF